MAPLAQPPDGREAGEGGLAPGGDQNQRLGEGGSPSPPDPLTPRIKEGSSQRGGERWERYVSPKYVAFSPPVAFV